MELKRINKKLKNIFKYVISVVIAIVLLYFSFKDIDFKNFVVGLTACRWEFVLLSMLFGVLSFYLRSLRWRLLLLPIDNSVSRITTFNAINISYIVNMVLPRAGEFVRCGYITENSSKDTTGRHKASLDKVIGTAIADRMWDAFMLFLIMIVFFTVMWGRFGSFILDNILSETTSTSSHLYSKLSIIGVIILCIIGLWIIYKLRNKNQICGKIWNVVKGIFKGLSSSLHIKQNGLFVLYNILVWIAYWMMSMSIIWAMQGIDFSHMNHEMASAFENVCSLNLIDALFLMIVGAISSLVPVPGGFGAFHYLVSLALTSVYGIPSEVGIVFAILSHESQTIIQIICGGCSYIYEVLKSKPVNS